MKIDKKFIADAHKTLHEMMEKDLLPPNDHWMWLEPNKVKLTRFNDNCFDFVTATETYQIITSHQTFTNGHTMGFLDHDKKDYMANPRRHHEHKTEF